MLLKNFASFSFWKGRGDFVWFVDAVASHQFPLSASP